MPETYALAADLGGTNLRTAAVSIDGAIVCQRKATTPKEGSAADVISMIASEARACIAEVSGTPLGFAIAAAALVDLAGTRVLSSPNLPQLDGAELSRSMSAMLGVSVRLENDATAAAIGENWLGASRGAFNSICITLGTGVGGGLILDGRPFRGTSGTAGEVGHICVEPDGLRCGCGSIGCLEQYASATAITRIARELSAKSPVGGLNLGPDLSAGDVYEAGRSGNSVALQTFQVMGRYLGIALADLIDILNPSTIVIGGGAAGAWDLFIDHVRTEVRSRAFRHPADAATIVRAELGDNAGILGAARVALQAAFPSS